MSRHQTRPCACARAGLPINCKSCRFHRALRAEQQRAAPAALRAVPPPSAPFDWLPRVANG